MDAIHIDGLIFSGKHGVHLKERNLEQEFKISLSLTVDTKVAGKSDKLSDTVDYQAVKDIVKRVVEGESRYLIERLADEIAMGILATDKKIKSATITVEKTAIWENGVPGVTIVRHRSEK